MRKFAASDDLKISQVEVISECKGSLSACGLFFFMLVILVQLTI